MSTSDGAVFRLPAGWTLRRVANALARDWLPPYLREAGPRAPRWILQPVVEVPDDVAPLWEAGISTAEYEERLDSADLTWAIRASVARGRGKGSVLARLSAEAEDPGRIHLSVFPAAVPETLFDTKKVDEYLEGRGLEGLEALVSGVLRDEGFSLAGNPAGS